ncbi:MAG: hypothetical protein NVSMB17_20060 [Candidatus Dormibacteria bacterium]
MRVHPRAAIEVSLLHLALLPMARRSPLTLLGTWLMAVTHLGLLGPGTGSIGLPNTLSLVRANLPINPTAPLLAMSRDLADGWIARRGSATAFGGFADVLADVTFWTRFGSRGAGRLLAGAVVAAWAAPAAAIAAVYFAKGRTIDYPRLAWVRRLSVGLQCVIAISAITRRRAFRETEWTPPSTP